MKIYIDMDDVICDTAKYFTKIAKELFDIELPDNEVRNFDLKKAFALNDRQYGELMKAGHTPANLLAYEEIPYASRVIGKWIDEGHDISVITGRPSGTFEPSRAWLDRHGLARAPLYTVDKYGRESVDQSLPFAMTLEKLYSLKFDLAIEDSPAAFEHVFHFENCTVAVFDRPWNRQCEFPNERFKRCCGWPELDKLLDEIKEK